MSRDAIETLVRELYVRRVRENVDEIMELFAPDAHFVVSGDMGSSALPLEVSGSAAIREAVDRQVRTFDLKDLDIRKIIIEGDSVAVHWRVRLVMATGSVLTDIVDLIELRDGKVTSFREFADTALAARAMSA